MATRVDEIADGILRLSTFMAGMGPQGFTFNQFLVMADRPLLFHCGMRALFASVSAAVATRMPVERLRYVTFGHVEADECGSMNLWLAAAPQAQIVHGRTACEVSLNDLADRPPRALADGEVLDLGGKRVRWIDTPHVPHAWESGLIFEETTGTLFSGDLFTHLGDGPAISGADIVPAAVAAEEGFHSTNVSPLTPKTIRALKRFHPRRIAVMHGSSFEGDCEDALDRLADYYDGALRAALSA